MTLSRNFKVVTFWDVINHQQYVLEGRVDQNQVANMMVYLRPGNDTVNQDIVKKLKDWKLHAKKLTDMDEDENDRENEDDVQESILASEEDEN